MKISITDIAIVGIFSALSLAAAYLLLAVHNVELFTATIFLSGILFGIQKGVLVGVIASTIFGIFNPYGMSPLPLLVAQVISRAAVGYAGGRFATLARSETRFWIKSISFGIIGILLIWLYIILSLLSEMFTFGFSFEQLKASFAFGSVSYALLTIGNALVFTIVLPYVTNSLLKSAYFQKIAQE